MYVVVVVGGMDGGGVVGGGVLIEYLQSILRPRHDVDVFEMEL